jgi:D-beta-D-heptose 7-phosphate kinase/D-beta-D-heptose 1-phosphate adenosyltransferase
MPNKKTVMVIGDVMLDTWIATEFQKISRETGVPINRVLEKFHAPGGAANAARVCKFLSMERVIAVGVIGSDSNGSILEELLLRDNIETKFFVDNSRPTTTKIRIDQGANSLIRLDDERIEPIDNQIAERASEYFSKNVPSLDAIMMSDYNKGFLTDDLIAKILTIAKENGVPVIADPAQGRVSKFRGCDIIKPNQFEWNTFVEENSCSYEELVRDLYCPFLVITKSDKGIEYCLEGKWKLAPGVKVLSQDITGAGDAVAAVLTCGTALGMEPELLIGLANSIASEFVMKERTQLPDDINHLLENFQRK